MLLFGLLENLKAPEPPPAPGWSAFRAGDDRTPGPVKAGKENDFADFLTKLENEAPEIAEAAALQIDPPEPVDGLPVNLEAAGRPSAVVPAHTQPINAQPAETQPIEAQPANAQPINAQPVNTQPVEARPIEAQPVEARPAAEARPVHAQPAEAQPAEAQPNEAQAVEARPINTQPVNSPPPHAQPGGTRPLEAQPAEAQPAKAQPAKAQPAKAQPAKAQPVHAQPIEAQPNEARPVNTQPANTQPVNARPIEAQPIEAEPAKAQLAEARPAEARPAAEARPVINAQLGNTQPADTQPVNTRPNEAQPIEARPNESRPSEARPAPTLAPSAGGDADDALQSASAALQNKGRRLAENAARRSRPAALLQPAATAVQNAVSTAQGNATDLSAAADLLKARLHGEFSETINSPTGHNPAGQDLTGPPPTGPRLAATLAPGAREGDWRGLTSGLLTRNRLALASDIPGPQVWGRGEGHSPAEMFTALERARAAWPAPFRKQVGLGLVALGRPGLSANSMTAGAALLGASSPGEVLQSILGDLKGELKLLKLPPQARDNLGRLLAASGLDQERLSRVMAGFGKDGLSLAELDKALAGSHMSGPGLSAGLSANHTPGLTATPAGLTELAHFLSSLGASAEVIDQAMNVIKPGQKVTGETLRDLFSNVEAGGLARTLGPGDLRSLAAFLREMGASPLDMGRLENLLGETSGQLSLGGFLSFLDSLKEAPVGAVTGQEMEELRALLAQIGRDQDLAKTPVFNETLIKLRVLGDAQTDDDYLEMSPALQALRGGLSGSEDFVGQQFRDRHENQERYRQMLYAAAAGREGPAASAGLSANLAAEGYGPSDTVSRQLAQKILYSRRRGLHRLKMNLNPAELGRLDIELAIKGGTLTARIKAESREAYEALGDEVAELKKALAQGGVELTELILAHDDAESGRTLTAGLAELTEAEAERRGRPGEVHRVI